MKNIETPTIEQENKFGVLGYRIENGHYIVDIRWKDGHKTEEHFPERGFPVVNPDTGEFIKKNLDSKDALKILEENAANMTAEEFSWLDFVGPIQK